MVVCLVLLCIFNQFVGAFLHSLGLLADFAEEANDKQEILRGPCHLASSQGPWAPQEGFLKRVRHLIGLFLLGLSGLSDKSRFPP